MNKRNFIVYSNWIKNGYSNYNCFLTRHYVTHNSKRIFFSKFFSPYVWEMILNILAKEYTCNKLYNEILKERFNA